MMRRLYPLAFLLALLVALPAQGQVTPEELEEAKSELLAVRDKVQGLADAYEAALAETEHIEWLIAGTESQAAELDRQLEETRVVATERAVDMYIGALANNLPLFTESGSLSDIEAGLAYMRDASDDDLALLNQLAVLERDIARVADDLANAQAAQLEASTKLEAAADEMNRTLEDAQAQYNEIYTAWQVQEAARIAAEQERLRLAEAARIAAGGGSSGGGGAPPPVVVSGRSCPVQGVVAFSDTWGAPRSGGRSHKGVDMLAARGTALVAIEAGTISRMGNGGIGGITIWFKGDSGDDFYYAHLDSFASGISKGQYVSAGTKIGTVGTSGNAPANVPHLHFEYHPGGGSAVNPTPLVRSLCG
jgi:murein DD-endopeptidase MepM/ murein hydrolase activator NlpD